VKGSADPVILVRQETNSDDIDGMFSASGVVTCQGGKTSHAAVVARGWGKPCVCGCSDLRIDPIDGTLSNGTLTLKEGDWVSIDGNRGWVISGRVELKEVAHTEEFAQFMSWVDRYPALEVRANADTQKDAERALQFGAKGIGLCRTEHMFFTEGRVRDVRRMILAVDDKERNSALDNLLTYQKEDFMKIFRVMDGLPVTIRLLDPPLHEFLPEGEVEIEQLAGDLDMDPGRARQRVASLREYNPMLGHRGCRLGITFPEISRMQSQAIFQAAVQITSEGKTVIPEVMIPLVGSAEEFLDQKRVVDEQARMVFEKAGLSVDYKVGTMIEVPRAALLAGEIAESADFFSFGTNDLTQMTFGFSRDDIGSFMPSYLEKGVLNFDPFQMLDRKGVGQLISMAVDRGRSVRSGLKIGICGEHGGDPNSIEFFCRSGFDYVSCSPFRVPVARLAAAQLGTSASDSPTVRTPAAAERERIAGEKTEDC